MGLVGQSVYLIITSSHQCVTVSVPPPSLNCFFDSLRVRDKDRYDKDEGGGFRQPLPDRGSNTHRQKREKKSPARATCASRQKATLATHGYGITHFNDNQPERVVEREFLSLSLSYDPLRRLAVLIVTSNPTCISPRLSYFQFIQPNFSLFPSASLEKQKI